MIDRDKVLKALECCLISDNVRKCPDECPYYERCWDEDSPLEYELKKDALQLLKEQEALPIAYMDNPYTGLPVAHCPKCGKFVRQYHAVYEEETKFCPYCGQAVKWDD